MGRDGVTPEHGQGGGAALQHADRRADGAAAAMPTRMLCGLVGRFDVHLEHVRDVIGLRAGARTLRHA